MATTITQTYFAQATAAKTPAQIKTLMDAVAIDPIILAAGLRITASRAGVIAGQKVTATIVMTMTPSVAGAFSATVHAVGQGGTGPITAVTVNPGVNGLDYIRPPVVTFADATGSGAYAYAQLGIFTVAFAGLSPLGVTLAAGAGYDGVATKIVATGGEPAPGAVYPTFALTFDGTGPNGGGAITSITPSGPGGPFNSPPVLTVVDPTGSGAGAVVQAQMGVSGVVLTNGGSLYTAPTVTLTPVYQQVNPNATVQAALVEGFMLKVFEQGMRMPVGFTAGVVA